MASITFEQLADESAACVGSMSLALRFSGYEGSERDLLGFGRIDLVFSDVPALAPVDVINGGGALSFAMAGSYVGMAAEPCVASLTLPLKALAFEAKDAGVSRLVLKAYGVSIGVGSIITPPLDGNDQVLVEDSMLHDSVNALGRVTAVLHERMETSASQYNSGQLFSRCESAATFNAALSIVYSMLIEEQVIASESSDAQRLAILTVIERLLVEGQAESYLDAVQQVTDGMILAIATQALSYETVVDEAVLNELVGDVATMVGRVVDEAILSEGVVATGEIRFTVREAIVGEDIPNSIGEFAERIADGLAFTAHLGLRTGAHVAWVLHGETRGLTQFTNYPFKSFAKLGSAYYGITDTGLYRLSGKDDDGEPIAARLRAGMSSLGTRRLKRIADVFIGYSGSGDLFLQVVQSNEQTGAREAAIYRMKPRLANSIRESRVKVGRGLKSVDFDFILENVNGSDFRIESIEFKPIVLDRRTRG